MSIHEARLGDGDESAGPARDAEDAPTDLESLGELAALQGVVKFPVRIKCATLVLEHPGPEASTKPSRTRRRGADHRHPGRR